MQCSRFRQRTRFIFRRRTRVLLQRKITFLYGKILVWNSRKIRIQISEHTIKVRIRMRTRRLCSVVERSGRYYCRRRVSETCRLRWFFRNAWCFSLQVPNEKNAGEKTARIRREKSRARRKGHPVWTVVNRRGPLSAGPKINYYILVPVRFCGRCLRARTAYTINHPTGASAEKRTLACRTTVDTNRVSPACACTWQVVIKIFVLMDFLYYTQSRAHAWIT